MPGVLQPALARTEPVSEEQQNEFATENAIAWALEMCPPGMAIEVHESYCDVIACSCIPRVIQKPLAA